MPEESRVKYLKQFREISMKKMLTLIPGEIMGRILTGPIL